jgi:dienelactone hydrolase
MNPFAYEPGTADFHLALRRSFRGYDLYDTSFISAAIPRLIGSDAVPAEYYRPQAQEPAPLVILLHGMGDTSLGPPRWLARSLAAKGYACFVPRLVVYSTRTPKIKDPADHLNSDEWFDAYRASVIEVKQVLDWAQTRPEIDRQKIAILGISFGAFVAALAMGVDNRIKAGILIEGAGNSVKINKLSRAIRTRYPGPPLDHDKLLKDYAEYLGQVDERGLDAVAVSNRGFLIDPLTYAPLIGKRPLLMINALNDEVFPRESTLDLWKATGKQAIMWLPGTHITIWLWYPLIRHRVETFLKLVFGN